MSAFDFINSPRVLNLRLLYNDLARLARTSSATKSSTPADVKPAGIIRRSPSVGDGQRGFERAARTIEHAEYLPGLRPIVLAVDCARAALADATCPVPATPESGRLAHRRRHACHDEWDRLAAARGRRPICARAQAPREPELRRGFHVLPDHVPELAVRRRRRLVRRLPQGGRESFLPPLRADDDAGEQDRSRRVQSRGHPAHRQRAFPVSVHHDDRARWRSSTRRRPPGCANTF